MPGNSGKERGKSAVVKNNGLLGGFLATRLFLPLLQSQCTLTSAPMTSGTAVSFLNLATFSYLQLGNRYVEAEWSDQLRMVGDSVTPPVRACDKNMITQCRDNSK